MRKIQCIHFSQCMRVQHVDDTSVTKENRKVCAYAFAVGEQNASGE